MFIQSILSAIIGLSSIYPTLSLILITILPITELRASIPYGILALKMNWLYVFMICCASNIAIGLILYLLIEYIVGALTYFQPIARIYRTYVKKTQAKIRDSVKQYGKIGVAIFIGIPLPFSGVYTGALASHLLGLSYKDFFLSCIFGVLIAGLIVLLITLTGGGMFKFLIKII